jgi:hypothetical protein
MKTLSIVLLAVPIATFAQDDGKPVSIGGFENQGSVTTGYRFTDVQGYVPKFNEMFDLNDGFRLLDFSLFGKAQDGANRFADNYSLTTSGLGGDPFTTAQFTVRKNHLYDLRVNFRQTHYYWNRNDAAALPNALNALTSNHDWATVRKLGSINLLIHATNSLRFTFEYYRNTRDGVSFTTRNLDYFGSSGTWGGFARADPYYLVAPLSETSNRVTGGLDYTRGGWNLHYRVGYQRFEDAVNGSNVSSPERSINIDDPNTARELVNGVSWLDSRKLSTPVSEFSYTGKLLPRLEARGGYIFYRYSGPAALDMSMDGSARTATATVVAPYLVSLTTSARVTEPNNIVDQGFTYKINDWWSALLDYRYSRFTVDSSAQFRSVNSNATAFGPSAIPASCSTSGSASSLVCAGTTSNHWFIGTHTLDYNMTFTPIASLLIRTGIRYMRNDVEFVDGGVVDPTRTKLINTVWPIGSVYYQPSKMLTIRADVEQTVNGASYTRVTPHTDIGGRFFVRFRPTEKFYLEDTAVVRNRKLIDTDYRSTLRNNSVTATYEFAERFSVLAGFSYDSFFASDFVSFLRGTAPFTNLALRDQTVDRVWQGGLRVSPVKGLGITFTGNFVRSTGLGTIAGEVPLYGPMSFPYASGSIYYDFPRIGRLTAQLQRTYYSEQIVPGNNFSANLLTIAWTHGF